MSQKTYHLWLATDLRITSILLNSAATCKTFHSCCNLVVNVVCSEQYKKFNTDYYNQISAVVVYQESSKSVYVHRSYSKANVFESVLVQFEVQVHVFSSSTSVGGSCFHLST